MSKVALIRSLAGVAVFQLLVLAGKYLVSVYPLWTGQPAVLEIEPVDPRSLFRGNYVSLRYTIANLDEQVLPAELQLRRGDVAYVHLKADSGVYRAITVSAIPPEEGLFIRGRVNHFDPESTHRKMSLRYGIEAYFAAKDRALDIENTFRDRRQEDAMAYAKVRIAGNGKAALEDIVWEVP